MSSGSSGVSDGGEETVFHKILAKEIPSTPVFEDDRVYAFRDIAPTAPVHVVVIPKERDGLTGVAAAEERHEPILGHLLWAAKKVAEKEGIHESGYRVVINQGKQGCQSVDFIHLHVIGGKQLTWPPGTGLEEGSMTG